MGPVRLNRYIAQAGICSRRKADELILEGRVLMNGEVVKELGVKVNPGDAVEVNGIRLTPRSLDYFLLNKPSNYITSKQDEKGRSVVMDLIDIPEKDELHLYPVGRLDRNSVGVLLITNDGELAHRLMHPRYQIDKLYKVRTKEPIKPHELEQLIEGVQLDDGPAKADDARYVSPENKHEIGVRLHEGRNRQIRRMLEAIGHEVDYLERVNYAGLTADGVRRGKWRRLRPDEIKKLKRLVKLG
ncbi:MAG: pseudouridine synthase [Rhodothermales bacterium]